MSSIPLVVTSDDYGLTDATSDAILVAHLDGIVTATSCLAVVPGVEPRLARLADAGDLSVGVHLAVVGEDPPVLSAAEVPTLVDKRGRFARSWRQLLPRLAAGRIDRDDLRREWRAQIELVRAHRGPTHLDTHQHVHLWPAVAGVVVELAVAEGIGAVRVPRPTQGGPRGRALGRLADALADRVDRAGLARTARYRGIDEAGRWDEALLVQTLHELSTGTGSVELGLHVGAVDDAERGRYAWGYGWGAELAATCAPAVAAAVDALGFELAGR